MKFDKIKKMFLIAISTLMITSCDEQDTTTKFNVEDLQKVSLNTDITLDDPNYKFKGLYVYYNWIDWDLTEQELDFYNGATDTLKGKNLHSLAMSTEHTTYRRFGDFGIPTTYLWFGEELNGDKFLDYKVVGTMEYYYNEEKDVVPKGDIYTNHRTLLYIETNSMFVSHEKPIDISKLTYKVGRLNPIFYDDTQSTTLAFNNPFVDIYDNDKCIGSIEIEVFSSDYDGNRKPALVSKEFCLNFIKDTLITLG